jgi:succinylarginine dihydrolase
MRVYEVNMDGLVGPTHHYAGLSAGNLASKANAQSMANPAAAAHQGIQKMRLLHNLGLKQAVLLPHRRPNLELLHELGFSGTPVQQIQKAARIAPQLLSACYSASSMWTANAATVSASSDTKDSRIHFTAANLITNLHRHQEADFSRKLLQQVFADERYFYHHPILPKTMITADEGAANHSRLCRHHQDSGLGLFVYGKRIFPLGNNDAGTVRYPARQTLEASQAIARSHQLDPKKIVFAAQNPAVIDQGVFHNDVIAVANESLLLLHEDAFLNQASVLEELRQKASFPIQIIEVSRRQLGVNDAVKNYLFNSQLVTLADKKMAMIAPSECETHPCIKKIIDDLLQNDDIPITQVHYLDLKQSMRNGGGPACLRLRVPLNEDELSAIHQGIIVTDALLASLDSWVDKHYRTELNASDLADPSLLQESFIALDELAVLLDLKEIYTV